MADKGKRDKGKREQQKKAKLTPKERRKQKKDKKKSSWLDPGHYHTPLTEEQRPRLYEQIRFNETAEEH